MEDTADLNEWFNKLQTKAQEASIGIHLILKLKVDYTKTHEEVILIGGKVSLQDYIFTVGKKYPPSGDGIIEENIVLLHFPWKGPFHFRYFSNSCNWAVENALRMTNQYVPSTIGKEFPKLDRELKLDSLSIVETTGCMFMDTGRVCGVAWLGNGKTEPYLGWMRGADSVWLAFRK